MKVKSLKTNNFQGLEGVHEFNFGKITALAQPNGSGKTSLINALRYGLTGVEPAGDVITRGASSMAVRVVLENDSSFLRQQYAEKKKKSRYFVGNASSTLSKLNEFICNELGGVDVNTAKMVSSGELLTQMTSQQFGEMLLRYLPESMTVETILERFSGKNEEQEKIVRDFFPEGEFGVEKINEFHNLLKERRKLVKEKITEVNALINSLGSVPPEESISDIEEKIKSTTDKRDEVIKAQEAMKNYNQILSQINMRNSQIQQIDNELAQLKGVHHTDEEINSTFGLLSNSRNIEQGIKASLNSLVQTKKTLDEAIENISKPICPLSAKIKCTVDKTPVLKELEEQRDSLVQDYKNQRDSYIELANQIKQLEAKYEQMINENNAYLRVQDKLKMKEQLLSQTITLPEKPEDSGSVEALNSELSNLQQRLLFVTNYSKKETYEEKLKGLTQKHLDYENLVLAFSPKGEVKEAITSYYMDEFSEPCNEKASKLFPGMKLKFVSENGVKVLTDPNGSGEYLEFTSLSGGEQASVMFLLVSMLASLSGMGIIILDELSVLDDVVFENLVRVLHENQDEFDMCLLASVDHVDTLKTLKKYDIPVIHLNTKNAKESKNDDAVNIEENVKPEAAPEDNHEIAEEHSDNAEEQDEVVISSDDSVEESKKLAVIDGLKDLVEKTAEETANMRFVPSDDDILEEELEDDEDEDESELLNHEVESPDAIGNEFEILNEDLTEVAEDVEDVEKTEAQPEALETTSNEVDLQSLGLDKGKAKVVTDFIINESSEDGSLEGSAKEIAEKLDISQPTVSKVLKKLQEENLLTSVKRGLWKLSKELMDVNGK